ncbi:MAG: right-handed parallel beta-helix repeat-containing protein, partial [FCB group bacterium]|nr:right-handed parallel beta-helix repeat-containing protein [FCB group bacterium]
MRIKFLILCSFCLFCSLLNSTTWHIKQDGTGNFTTIQAGINASVDADTVLVYPGTYYENINYNGNSITVASLELTTNNPQYISQTVIDGQRLSSCVAIISGETDACLRGLTITNGEGGSEQPLFGGGISIYGDYPDMIECNIINCIVINNYSVNSSAGINITDGIVFLSGCSIRQNNACRVGGGLGIGGYSQVTFDPVNRCNIYNNFAGSGLEIFVETIQYNFQEVIVDTFTVAQPDRYFAQVFPGSWEFTYIFDILHPLIEPVDHDLYVSPLGDDSNSGLSPDEPLRMINLAVRNIASNPDNPHTVHLAEGIYNHSDNQQLFAIGCKAYVDIVGEDMDTTIIDGEFEYHPFFITASDYHNSTIKNITFRNAIYYNTFLMVYYSDLIRFENILVQNCTNYSGAAILSATSGGHIEFINVIVDNQISQEGNNSGAWINETTSFIAKNCTFSNNSCVGSTALSAGLYAMSSGDIIIDNCKFINNSTTSTTWLGWASAFMCIDYNDEMGDTYINNCLFTGNSNSGGKSTIYAKSLDNGTVHFSNNTVVDNQSNYGIEFKGDIEFTNNIARNNCNYEIALFDEPGVTSEIDIAYNNIDRGQNAVYNQNNANIVNWGEGNIEGDPLFLFSGDDPYQLTELSPCIDTGIPDTTGLFLPPWDLLHNYRVWDGDENGIAIIDMGCYEFGADSVNVINYELPITNYELRNYPNPFNPETKIVFDLPE